MKKILLVMLLSMIPSLSWAYPPSILGGKAMGSGTAHDVSVGWPSVKYEWWNAGKPDWALGAELVYGDWSGEYSDVEIGLGLNVPLKWQLKDDGKVAVGFKFQPGVLIGDLDAPGNDRFVFGMRGEAGVPISIGLAPQLNLITGVSVPFTMLIVENADNPGVVIPILPRIGIEVMPTGIGQITLYFLVEVGPTIGIASGNTEVDAGIRGWMGATFW